MEFNYSKYYYEQGEGAELSDNLTWRVQPSFQNGQQMFIVLDELDEPLFSSESSLLATQYLADLKSNATQH